jgi:hypothetical protein
MSVPGAKDVYIVEGDRHLEHTFALFSRQCSQAARVMRWRARLRGLEAREVVMVAIKSVVLWRFDRSYL